MSQQQMTFDSEAIAAAVNQIDVAIADIETRNNKFIALLEEKNNQTRGKFPLVAALKPKIAEEAANIKSAIEATEAIKESIAKYQSLTEEANDTSWMNR